MGLHSQKKNHNHKLWPFERSKIKIAKMNMNINHLIDQQMAQVDFDSKHIHY
jgi:hypothetical protein